MPTTASDTLKFEPGIKLDYSNYGYRLLRAIIEKVSGKDYYTYVRQHIFKPAGMTNTDNYELDAEPQNLATGLYGRCGRKAFEQHFQACR